MYKLSNLPFDNSFVTINPSLYTRVQPKGLCNPKLVSVNPAVADLLCLDHKELQTQEFIQFFGGHDMLPGSDPVAMVYSGHQFGSYNPQLGDGRGLLLGEIATPQGNWDLHLKGAGRTPYSRMGDGRAVLRSSIREYLCSEAMAGLGIATTRALCIVGSDEPVYRESVESGAMVLRVARSHIRFGHFEHFHYNGRTDIVKQLADYVIKRHYPNIEADDKYYQFLLTVVNNTAELIARWQTVGFAHGVMNTDNMSILGDTFDYGPFAFLDDYNPGFICNHSDYQGRYAFNRQPSIALWNLNALAHGLSSLIETEKIKDALSRYEPILLEHIDQYYREKFGLLQAREDDQQLVTDALTLLQNEQGDYTLFFLALNNFTTTDVKQQSVRDRFVDREVFDHWAERYKQRLQWEQSDDSRRHNTMRQVNPKFILRNYLAQLAIERACHHDDYSEIDQLLQVLQSPYDDHPGLEHYAKEPPDWGKKLEISCSS